MVSHILLLEDLRSVHNVGSLFRTCNALGIHHILLSGITPTPLDAWGKERKDFAKVALGATDEVRWEYQSDAGAAISAQKALGYKVIVIEQDARAVDYKTVKVHGGEQILFVLGNEVEGVSECVRSLADVIAEIPMHGSKESLNVHVSGAVAMYRILDK